MGIVQCMCDIHPMLPNQCISAELKNLPGGIIHLPWTTGAQGLLFFSCAASSPLLFYKNEVRLFSALKLTDDSLILSKTVPIPSAQNEESERDGDIKGSVVNCEFNI